MVILDWAATGNDAYDRLRPKLKLSTSRKRMASWMFWVAAASLVAGCDSVPTRFVTGLSAEQRQMAESLPVYDVTLPEGTYQQIAPVVGVSCQLTHDDPYRVSDTNAVEELKRAAVKAGGNAIMEVQCDRMGRGQGIHRCFRSIECTGTAVLQKTGATSVK